MKRISLQPRHALLIVFFILLISYSLFQARAILVGPRIWIESPQDGQVVGDSLVVATGRAENIAWISLNDRQIFTDEQGRWGERLIVSEGISTITVKARDRFGRETEKNIRIIFNG